MDASHESLRGDYEVSSPALDQLVTLAREGGAAGARLTGAGFGVCMVALADESHADRVLNSLEEAYYRDRGLGTALGQALFRVEPSGGASVEEF
jgi:galactokinase